MSKVYAVTGRTLCDQDWKTQLAGKYPNIPANSIVEIIDDNYINFYGTWVQVKWNNNTYYVDRNDLVFDKESIENAKQYYGEELKQYDTMLNKNI